MCSRTKFIIAILSTLLLTGVSFASSNAEDHIAPIGYVNVSGDAPSDAAVASGDGTQVASGKSGKQTYDQYCMVCHAAGVAGAPRFKNAGDWKPRIAKGLPTLLNHAVKGVGAMPAKGTCQTCSEGDLKAAIKYMLPN